MTIWENKTDYGRGMVQMFVAKRAASLLRTHLGPDYDVVLDGRLVSASSYIPQFDPRKPPSDEDFWKAIDAAAERFAHDHAV